MAFRITVEPDFVRAELTSRQTVQETKDFLRALVRYSERQSRILIQVSASKPIFQVEQHGLLEYFKEIARTPFHQIALLADTRDLQVSHEYVEFVARQRGLNVRSCRFEAEALQWLRQAPQAPQRRQQERRQVQVRHGELERRRQERRGGS
jgi:hypothetical protein